MRPLQRTLLRPSRPRDLPVQGQESRQTGEYIPHLRHFRWIGDVCLILVSVGEMILYCTFGAIFLGIVIALILFTLTKKGTIEINIDFRQEDDTEL